jgi:hypothetical protein
MRVKSGVATLWQPATMLPVTGGGYSWGEELQQRGSIGVLLPGVSPIGGEHL